MSKNSINKMNAPTELYEKQYKSMQKQQQEQQQQQQSNSEQQVLLDNINATTKTTAKLSIMPMNGVKPYTKTTTNIASSSKLNGIDEIEEERIKNRNRNLAKINWWYTPFKPLTIETVVDQQQLQQQQQLKELNNENMAPVIPDQLEISNKDEERRTRITENADATHLYMLEQDQTAQDNENSNEQKEEKDSLMSNGMYACNDDN